MKRSDGYIDQRRWPQLSRTPEAVMMFRRAATVTQRLNALLREHGVALDSQTDPHMIVRDGQLIDRLVAAGWLGLAEGYMAGEWDADPLSEVLKVLLTQPFEARLGQFLSRRQPSVADRAGEPMPGELPEGLIELYAGATRATGSALFSSSSRTTSREHVDVRVRGSRGSKVAPVTIEQTWLGSPVEVERQDLDDAQRRRIEVMLDHAGVRPGDRVLELPSSGGQLAIQAALRGAHVDVLTGDEDHAEAVMARARAAGLSGAIHVEVISTPIPSPRQWSGRYEAIFSVERMETVGKDRLVHFLRAVDRLLAADGIAIIQSIVAAPGMRETARESLDVMRAYVWPGMHYPTVDEVRSTVLKSTDLSVTAESYLGAHLGATLPLWRANFLSRDRQAAAAGFDHVFRRLWDYQLALHQALVESKDIECVQFALRPRR
ncbi:MULTISPECIES: class I SAM-dependent methyltransferase [Corynebacterium]|nr:MULTISPECIES: class I SAM-dependent methyltransferase [Corynebacterium]